MAKLTQIFKANFFHCKIYTEPPKKLSLFFLEAIVLNCISGIKNEDDTQFLQINLEEFGYKEKKPKKKRSTSKKKKMIPNNNKSKESDDESSL